MRKMSRKRAVYAHDRYHAPEHKAFGGKYDIQKVDPFGSYANGKATGGSDADFLVTFSAGAPSILKVMGFKQEPEDCLQYRVDAVTMPLAQPDRLQIGKVVNVYDRA